MNLHSASCKVDAKATLPDAQIKQIQMHVNVPDLVIGLLLAQAVFVTWKTFADLARDRREYHADIRKLDEEYAKTVAMSHQRRSSVATSSCTLSTS